MSGNSPFCKPRDAQASPLMEQVILEQYGSWEKPSRSTNTKAISEKRPGATTQMARTLQKREIYPRGMDLPLSLGLSTTGNAIQDQRQSPLLPQQG